MHGYDRNRRARLQHRLNRAYDNEEQGLPVYQEVLKQVPLLPLQVLVHQFLDQLPPIRSDLLRYVAYHEPISTPQQHQDP